MGVFGRKVLMNGNPGTVALFEDDSFPLVDRRDVAGKLHVTLDVVGEYGG
jgi:hypothetical protein